MFRPVYHSHHRDNIEEMSYRRSYEWERETDRERKKMRPPILPCLSARAQSRTVSAVVSLFLPLYLCTCYACVVRQTGCHCGFLSLSVYNISTTPILRFSTTIHSASSTHNSVRQHICVHERWTILINNILTISNSWA